jgi:hypothetical protein
MVVDRYVQFQAQTGFTGESFDTFGGNAHALDVSGEDITGDHQYIYPATVTGRTKRDRITGPKKFSGPIDTPIFPVSATSLIYYGLGSVTTTQNTPTTAHNEHKITKGKTLPFFRAGIGRDLKEHQYVGGMISSFTLDWDPNEVFSGSFDTVFRRELSPLGTLNTSAPGSFFPDYSVTERAFGGSEVSTLVNGTDEGDCFESVSISVENNVADDAYCLGSPYLSAGVIAGLEITGSFDLVYETSTRYTQWLDGTEIQLELRASYGASESERRVWVDLPKISMDTNKLPTDNIERYVQTVDFTAETDSNGDPIIVTVVNAEANTKFAG